jgi:hypothetical protein
MSAVLNRARNQGRDELTAEESEEYLNEQSLRYFGIPITEFRQRAVADTLPADDPVVLHIALLAGVTLPHC